MRAISHYIFFVLTVEFWQIGYGSRVDAAFTSKKRNSFWYSPAVKRIIKKTPALAEVLKEAETLYLQTCAELMSNYRWNCSVGSSQSALLRKAFKETAFLYALHASSILSTIINSCEAGAIPLCACTTGRSSEVTSGRTRSDRWPWAGCEQNFRYASRITQRLMRKSIGPDPVSLREKVALHNWRAGIKSLLAHQRRKCTCHGLWGSCRLQTCWWQVDFNQSSLQIRDKYDKAVRYETPPRSTKTYNNRIDLATNRIIRYRDGPVLGSLGSSRNLIYLDDSPDFCNVGRYSTGTEGRVCAKEMHHCDWLCCSKGFRTDTFVNSTTCDCRVRLEERQFNVRCAECHVISERRICN